MKEPKYKIVPYRTGGWEVRKLGWSSLGVGRTYYPVYVYPSLEKAEASIKHLKQEPRYYDDKGNRVDDDRTTD
jgi:hypothetical protein